MSQEHAEWAWYEYLSVNIEYGPLDSNTADISSDFQFDDNAYKIFSEKMKGKVKCLTFEEEISRMIAA